MRNYARDAPGTKCVWTATTAVLERTPYLGWIPFFRSELLLYGIKLHPYMLPILAVPSQRKVLQLLLDSNRLTQPY